MELHQEIDSLVKDVWKKQMKKDYDNCVFWEESVLKSAFYHHLRERIRKNKILGNLILYPEMRVRSPKNEPSRIDLAVVEIPECGVKTSVDCDRRWKECGSCIRRLIAVFEFKHWDRIYRRPLETAVKKFRRHFQEGVYYLDDNSKNRNLLTAELLYFGIVLDNKISRFPSREKIIGKPDSHKDLQLLIGGNVRNKLEFECL